MCTTPAQVENGRFDPNKESYVFGEVVRYSCIKGLVLSGSKDLICSHDGRFSSSPPKCVSKCWAVFSLIFDIKIMTDYCSYNNNFLSIRF